VVFHKTENSSFFWTSAYTPKTSATFDTFDTPLGNRATIFDQFGLQMIAMNNSKPWIKEIQILVPTDLRHFIQQIPNAEFLECNRTFAEILRSKSANNLSNAVDVLNRFTLEQTKALFRATFIPF